MPLLQGLDCVRTIEELARVLRKHSGNLKFFKSPFFLLCYIYLEFIRPMRKYAFSFVNICNVSVIKIFSSLIWKRTGSNACVGDANYLVLVKTYSRQVGDLGHFALHVNPTVDIW